MFRTWACRLVFATRFRLAYMRRLRQHRLILLDQYSCCCLFAHLGSDRVSDLELPSALTFVMQF
jgi:hypothetical protein